MKKLHLLRHAKSSWEDMSLADVNRPLNTRGKKACPIMAEKILEAGCQFDNVFCSVARRTRDTIQGIADAMPKLNFTWTVEDELYSFDYGTVLSWCRRLDNSLEEVLIVGHNPAITNLSNYLNNGRYIDNVPTCGYVQLVFEGDWGDLSKGCAKLSYFLTPKS